MRLKLSSRLASVVLPAFLGLAATAQAQTQPQPLPQQQQQTQANPVCTRLETQLAAFDRGGGDPTRVEQIKKYEAAAQQQQAQLDRLNAQAKKSGCENTGFFSSMFGGGQSASCGPLNGQIQQMKGNLDRIQGDLARLQGSDPAPEREGQRRALIGALAQNDCGPQYRQAAAQPPRGNLMESLFGANAVAPGTSVQGENTPSGSGYRTVCVRMCDGYYYPISYTASPSKFPEDERACQASCPAAEAQLFSHRNPGEDMNHAVSQTGQLYTAIPNAFKYRQSFDNACTCKGGAQQVLKGGQDPTLQSGDVVVNEERARQMSQPRVDAQGKPIKLEIPPRPAKPEPKAAATPEVTPEAKEDDTPVKVTRDPNRPVRQVGPNFIAR